MALKFANNWRFTPPEDGRYINKAIPQEAVAEFMNLAQKIATQGEQWAVIEHFKSFTTTPGSTNYRSSSEQWAISDLGNNLYTAAENAPVFIESFFDACTSLKNRNQEWWLPDQAFINELLRKHKIGYEIREQNLVALEDAPAPVPVPKKPPSLEEAALGMYQASMDRAEQLLLERRPREAVQELLWLLETISTAFRGIETASGTVAGKYFNHIVRDLRTKTAGTTLDRVMDWVTSLHGYLSSPSGGGVRHGLDLEVGTQITPNEGRLYCNLIRSYIAYLLGEHERLQVRR